MSKPAPLYERVKTHIRHQIATGAWPDHARLPSEYQLMETFQASRMTVHRALREISAEGLITRIQGAGSFVQQQKPRSALMEITDIAADIAARHHRHSATIITLETRHAGAVLAAEFNLPTGAALFYSLIVHHEDRRAVQLEERYIAPAFAPAYMEQDFTRRSTASYLQMLAPPSAVEHVIHAISPDTAAQSHLGITPQEPCLRLIRRTWTKAGPATKSILTHPGSRYSLGSRFEFALPTAKQPAL